jgi:hypothetical protein
VKPRRDQTARGAPAAERPEPAQPAQAQPAQPTRVEAGGDLGITKRRSPDRIDLENPYQTATSTLR